MTTGSADLVFGAAILLVLLSLALLLTVFLVHRMRRAGRGRRDVPADSGEEETGA